MQRRPLVRHLSSWALVIAICIFAFAHSSVSAQDSTDNSMAASPVFVHIASADNITDNWTYIDHPRANNNPDAIILITQSWNPGNVGGTYNDHAVGVWYDATEEKWAIFNQDLADMPIDAAFNVLVWDPAMWQPETATIADERPLVDTQGAPATMIEEASATEGYYRLQTMFLEEENKCLEGNRLAEESVLAGAAFMDDCQEVTGQLWKFVEAGDGYYYLQTLFLEEEGKCLEGNRLDPDSVLGGGAFMDDCQEVNGQLWKFVEADDGYYYLQTMFLEEQGKCLEGNGLDPDSVLAGAAFMDDCQEVTGQLWKIIPAEIVSNDTGAEAAEEAVAEETNAGAEYYHLQTMFLEEEGKCLEGNQSESDFMGGNAFMDDCQEVTGQFWKVVEADDGYYRLQTMFLEEEGKCLEGNQSGSEFMGGAAFMDDCQDVSGQLWSLVEAGDDYYYLQNMFLEEEGKCLEGNQSESDFMGGNAFMDDCQEVTGQLWKFVPVR